MPWRHEKSRRVCSAHTSRTIVRRARRDKSQTACLGQAHGVSGSSGATHRIWFGPTRVCMTQFTLRRASDTIRSQIDGSTDVDTVSHVARIPRTSTDSPGNRAGSCSRQRTGSAARTTGLGASDRPSDLRSSLFRRTSRPVGHVGLVGTGQKHARTPSLLVHCAFLGSNFGVPKTLALVRSMQQPHDLSR